MWIPIGSSEPPLETPILVSAHAYGSDIVTVVEVHMQSSYAHGYVRGIRAVGFDGRDIDSDFYYNHITHWMPIPATAPAQMQCDHRGTARHHGYDHVECECGAFMTDSGWGVASNRWFKSRSEAEFYRQNGRLPE